MNKYREQFEKETGYHWINSQGEPDIDYVEYLESKLEQAEKLLSEWSRREQSDAIGEADPMVLLSQTEAFLNSNK